MEGKLTAEQYEQVCELTTAYTSKRIEELQKSYSEQWYEKSMEEVENYVDFVQASDGYKRKKYEGRSASSILDELIAYLTSVKGA